MAGHSKFKNIMHRKGRADSARSKLFSKLSREITENYYAELKMHKLCLEMGATAPTLGEAPIGRADKANAQGD